jgi:regulator of replication initiation timing
MQTKEKDAMRDVSRMKEQMDSVLKESQGLKTQMAELVEDRITLKIQIES